MDQYAGILLRIELAQCLRAAHCVRSNHVGTFHPLYLWAGIDAV
jgi:hypothetical protein